MRRSYQRRSSCRPYLVALPLLFVTLTLFFTISPFALFFSRAPVVGSHVHLQSHVPSCNCSQQVAVDKQNCNCNCNKARRSLHEQGDFELNLPPYIGNFTNKQLLYTDGMWWTPEHTPPTLTAGVLVYREKESLLGAFQTWLDAGLLELADEWVIYYQELDEDKLHWLDPFVDKARGPIRVIGSPNNEPLLTASNWIIGNATSDMVLFLEKDWQLLEPRETALAALEDGKRLLEYEVAHVVRYRSRRNAGNPLYCKEIYEGRESEIVKKQKNLMCCAHHWLSDEVMEKEYKEYFFWCPYLPKRNNHNHNMYMEPNHRQWWCSRAEHCLWTNNPYMIRKEWWDVHYRPLVSTLTADWASWTKGERALDIEFLFGWNPAMWNARGWVIALGEGLFTHVERAEHEEVDYKAMRREAEEEDRKQKQQVATKTQQPSKETPEDMPLGRQIMSISSDKDWSSHSNFKQRGLPIWELHTPITEDWVAKGQAVLEQCRPDQEVGLETKPEGVRGDITIATGLFDLGRGTVGNGAFKRGLDEYFARLQRILDNGFPMVLYIPAEFKASLNIDESRVKVIEMTIVDAIEHWFKKYNARVQEIRTSDLYKRQAAAAGWLASAPQAILPAYNPLVMAKPFLLKEVADLNPWNTKYFMFLDAGHLCAPGMVPEKMSVFEQHMQSGLLATFWRYEAAAEVHGMPKQAFASYLGQDTNPVKVVRGGVFGGTAARVSCFADLYRVALEQTLSDGYMGTEENLFAMVFQRFPDLFSCHDNDKDFGAANNCALWASNNQAYEIAAAAA